MRRRLLQLTAVTLSIACSALGPTRSVRAERKLETYSAVEGESQAAESPSVTPAPKKTRRRSKPEAAFDPVPGDQLESIARRVQLVERLVREHARAYDYRTHTLAELEDIVARLDLEKARSSQAEEPQSQ